MKFFFSQQHTFLDFGFRSEIYFGEFRCTHKSNSDGGLVMRRAVCISRGKKPYKMQYKLMFYKLMKMHLKIKVYKNQSSYIEK